MDSGAALEPVTLGLSDCCVVCVLWLVGLAFSVLDCRQRIAGLSGGMGDDSIREISATLANRLDCGKCGDIGGLQVPGCFHREYFAADGFSGHGGGDPAIGSDPAGRDQLLYVPIHELHHRRLSRGIEADAKCLSFLRLSVDVSSTGGGANRTRRDLLPQLEKSVSVNEEDRWEGFVLVIHGLFKKVVIADNVAPFVNHAFEM